MQSIFVLVILSNCCDWMAVLCAQPITPERPGDWISCMDTHIGSVSIVFVCLTSNVIILQKNNILFLNSFPSMSGCHVSMTATSRGTMTDLHRSFSFFVICFILSICCSPWAPTGGCLSPNFTWMNLIMQMSLRLSPTSVEQRGSARGNNDYDHFVQELLLGTIKKRRRPWHYNPQCQHGSWKKN